MPIGAIAQGICSVTLWQQPQHRQAPTVLSQSGVKRPQQHILKLPALGLLQKPLPTCCAAHTAWLSAGQGWTPSHPRPPGNCSRLVRCKLASIILVKRVTPRTLQRGQCMLPGRSQGWSTPVDVVIGEERLPYCAPSTLVALVTID